jgi:hypothetical protein
MKCEKKSECGVKCKCSCMCTLKLCVSREMRVWERENAKLCSDCTHEGNILDGWLRGKGERRVLIATQNGSETRFRRSIERLPYKRP